MMSRTVLLVVTILSWVSVSIGGSPEDLYPNQRRQEEYDYIIIGAGSTGSVVASRLSEDTNSRVLLLEAGGVPPNVTEIPMECFHLQAKPETDWMYLTVPQKDFCLDFPEQKCFWSRFKGLGGCSSHNTMLYMRGAHKDFDNWVKLGAKGWGWKDVLPLFKKSEDFRIPKFANNVYHATGGYQTVSPLQYKTKLFDSLLEAGKYLGYDNVDYNGESQIGFSEAQLTQRDGRRCSAEKAFLRPAAGRENLDILINALVIKIEFDDQKRATSVVYEQGNKTMKVSARKEIILSAGAIGSPQILMLSGVGPKEHLEELKIPLVSDLPVGQNLHDHVHMSHLVYKLNGSVGFVPSRDVKKERDEKYFEQGKGPYTSPNAVEVMIYPNTSGNPDNDWPDLLIVPVATSFLLAKAEYSPDDQMSMVPLFVRPKSRGYLKLNITNPRGSPIMQPNYLTEEHDIQRMAEAVRKVREIIQTPALQQYNPTPTMPLEACKDLDWLSEEYVDCMARKAGSTILHMAGTNRMGNPADATTVVDPELRVRGVKGLRVADASVMPQLVSSTPNAACLMIGEKLAEMLMSKAQ